MFCTLYTSNQQQENRAERKQVGALLEKIVKRDDSAFYALCEVLEATNQEYIVRAYLTPPGQY